MATVFRCSWKTDQKGGGHTKTQCNWRNATLLGTLTYIARKNTASVWEQTSNFRIAMGRNIAQE